jgi:hypothetical protein
MVIAANGSVFTPAHGQMLHDAMTTHINGQNVVTGVVATAKRVNATVTLVSLAAVAVEWCVLTIAVDMVSVISSKTLQRMEMINAVVVPQDVHTNYGTKKKFKVVNVTATGKAMIAV